MQVIITSRATDGSAIKAQSADGRYTWFVGQDDYINDTQAGRSIYQMSYLRTTGFGSDDLPADVRADVTAFWTALRADEQAVAAPVAEPAAQISDAEFFARRAAEKRHDDVHNEGGEGYNPYRAS